MGRPSLRSQRRAELAAAFARVLATHGSGGATIAAVAEEAGIAPGLVHHYFSDKQDLYVALVDGLMAGFRRQRAPARDARDPVVAYADAALALDERADLVAARAWVGVLAEALSDPLLFDKLRRLLDAEVLHIEQRARGTLSTADASAVLAFIIGALVFGAFAPRKTAGFAAPSLRRMLAGLRSR
jgi:TetR/AcrR family transcriptional repressor of bet genes